MTRLQQVCLALALAVGSLTGACASAGAADIEPVVSAHRGGAGQWPQNSLLAFRNALAAHYAEIEGDAWLTTDGVAVIYHDATLSRTRCRGPFTGTAIRLLSSAQLARERCSGQRIPTAEQLFTLIHHSGNERTVLRLETKSYAGQSPASARAWAARIGELVVRAGLARRAIMQDFNWNGLAGYHAASRVLRTSALSIRPTHASIARAARLGAYDVSYAAQFDTRWRNELIADLHMVPTIWGVDSVPQRPRVLAAPQQSVVLDAFCDAVGLGSRVVITNYPALDRAHAESCG